MILKSYGGDLFPDILYSSQPNTVSFTWNGSRLTGMNYNSLLFGITIQTFCFLYNGIVV